jgi:hypothetical protein
MILPRGARNAPYGRPGVLRRINWLYCRPRASHSSSKPSLQQFIREGFVTSL